MLLYNVSIKIDRASEQEWLVWMKQKHIPDVMNTGQFENAQLCKLLDQPRDEEATYVIQYSCSNRENYDRYIERFATGLREEHNARYKGRFVAFRTLMEIVWPGE